MFLVLGITSRVGGAAARHLLAQGKQVRALVRDRAEAADWANQGVALVDGDWTDADAITRALQGVGGAFVLLPPVSMPSRDLTEPTVLIAAYAKALTSVRLPRLVVLSSYGAEKTSGLGSITPLSLLEHILRGLPYPHAFIRPGTFYEDLFPGIAAGRSGTLPVFYERTGEQQPMTAVKDVGAEAARLLTGRAWAGERVIELGSMVSADELAEQLGAVLGREVTARALPRDAWVPTLEQMGVPSGQTWAIEEMYDGANSHWIGFGAEGAERVEGTTSARDVFAAAQRARRGRRYLRYEHPKRFEAPDGRHR